MLVHKVLKRLHMGAGERVWWWGVG
jgi:hypothetical protein